MRMERLVGLDCGWDLEQGLLEGPGGVHVLSEREISILRALVQAAGAAVSREVLADEARLMSGRAVDFAVRRLRAKMERDPREPRALLTVHGHGYRLGLAQPPSPPARPQELLILGACQVDPNLGVISGPSGRQTLTTQQRLVLGELVRRAPAVVPREELARLLGRRSARGAARPVDTAIVRLRQLLEPDPAHPRYLHTVRHVGYRLQLELPRTNLPPAPPLRYRDEELARCLDALQQHRCLLITGAPGSGKTRLAEQVCRTLAERPPGRASTEAGGEAPPVFERQRENPRGVPPGRASTEAGQALWVDCSSLGRASEVARAAAAVLGAAEEGDPVALLSAALARRLPLVLVFDNLEQVEDVEPMLCALLKQSSARLVLTSSRRLDLPAQVVKLQGLSLQDGRALYLELAAQAGARELPDPGDVDVLVSSVEGLPLAIELAARSLPAVPPGAWPAGPEGLDRLAGSPVRGRHASIRSALDWVWRLCSPEQRRALVGCAVFLDPFDVEAASAVCDVPVHALQALVERSLLSPVTGQLGRFQLSTLLRAYLLERSPPDPAQRARHAMYFASRARRLDEMWRTPRHDEARRESLRCQRDFEAASEWLIEHSPDEALQILAFLTCAGWLDSTRTRQLLQKLLQGPPFPRLAEAWCYAANLELMHGEVQLTERMLDHAREAGIDPTHWPYRYMRCSLAAHRADWVGADPGEPIPERPDYRVDWHDITGLAAYHRGEVARAREVLHRGQALARRRGDALGESHMLSVLGQMGGPPAQMAELYEQMTRREEAEGHLRGSGQCAFAAGQWRVREGKLDRARELARQALVLGQALGDGRLEVRGRGLLLRLALADDPPEQIQEEAEQLIALTEVIQDKTTLTWLHFYRCVGLARAGQRERAAREAQLGGERIPLGAAPLFDLARLLGLSLPEIPEPFTPDAIAVRGVVAHVTAMEPLPRSLEAQLSGDPLLRAVYALAEDEPGKLPSGVLSYRSRPRAARS
jgi:DNA-binding response OmpR family regulator